VKYVLKKFPNGVDLFIQRQNIFYYFCLIFSVKPEKVLSKKNNIMCYEMYSCLNAFRDFSWEKILVLRRTKGSEKSLILEPGVYCGLVTQFSVSDSAKSNTSPVSLRSLAWRISISSHLVQANSYVRFRTPSRAVSLSLLVYLNDKRRTCFARSYRVLEDSIW